MYSVAYYSASTTALVGSFLLSLLSEISYKHFADYSSASANFWSLIWVILGIGIGISYFVLTFVATHLAYVSTSHGDMSR